MKVIISTGQGRLHLIESAKYLFAHGVDVRVITGWVPSISDKMVNRIGRILGSKNLAYGMNRRKELGKDRTYTCGRSEFFIQILFLLSRFKLLKREKAAVLGWKRFGRQSKQYLKNANVFHVRSGAGQGGAIQSARKNGMKILVDHSAAHPQATYNQLIKAGIAEKDIFIKPDSIFWQLVMKDCEQADVILVNSDYVKETFVNNGYDADKIHIVYLGIREDFIGLKKDWSLNGAVRLLFTGNFSRLKGAYLILECVKQLHDAGCEYHLDIVGSIEETLIIPEWSKNNPQITFHGHLTQDHLKSFFKESDIYIFPSYSEGSAQSLKEAMAAGLPVVATRQSGAPIIHKVNGYLVPENSSLAIKDAIIELSNEHVLRKKIGCNAAETIEHGHTWRKYAEQVRNVYTELLT